FCLPFHPERKGLDARSSAQGNRRNGHGGCAPGGGTGSAGHHLFLAGQGGSKWSELSIPSWGRSCIAKSFPTDFRFTYCPSRAFSRPTPPSPPITVRSTIISAPPGRKRSAFPTGSPI